MCGFTTIYSAVYGHLGVFQSGAIMNSAAMGIAVPIAWCVYTFLLSIYTGMPERACTNRKANCLHSFPLRAQ